MWWAGSCPIHVYLGERLAGVSMPSQPDAWVEVDSVSNGWRWADESVRFGSKEGAWRRAVHIWLSGSLARPFMLPELPGVRTEDEARKIAESLAAEETGLVGDCVVRLDRWSKSGSTLGTAMSSEVWGMLFEKSTSIGTPQSVSPWWCIALNQALNQEDGLELVAVREADATTVLGGGGRSVDLAKSVGRLDRESTMQLLSRLAVSGAIEGPAAMVTSSAVESGLGSAVSGVPFGALTERCS